ncbi:MAG: HDOD domain-containing protein [Acidobacteria bacterium]|nr:HDOD domain-containing protein [Acidobacteriota bacterium]
MVSTPADSRLYEQQALKGLGQLPPFSPILQRLMGEMAHEAVSFATLAGLIEKDTALTGNVLRVVNSPLYSLRATVCSVRHALTILGLAKLRNIVLSLSVSRLWAQVRAPPGWSMPLFNRHAVAVAMLADLLALETGVPDGEGAFSAGLLHDLGKLLMAITLPDCDEEALPGWTHADLSAAALQCWNLPAPIVEAVRHHHRPPAGGPLSLDTLVCGANRLAHALSLSCRGVASDESPDAILEQIGLADQAPALLEDFQREFDAIREFF